MLRTPNKYRVTVDNARRVGIPSDLATTDRDLDWGMFVIPAKEGRRELTALATSDLGWEHVSVHAWSPARGQVIPTWDEMNYVKDIFWEQEDCVVQYHPPKSEYVDNHPYVLHLWRCTDGRETPRPPYWMVGNKPGQTRAKLIEELNAAGVLRGKSA